MTNNVSFGKRIQQLRQTKDISQRQLAKRVDMDFTYLSKIENDRMPPPKEDVIECLAKALETDLNDLLILVGKVPPVLGKTLQKSEAARRFFFRHASNLKEEDWEEIIREVEKDSKSK